MPGFTIERPHRRTCRVRMVVSSTTGWEQWFLLRSDAHHDHAQARWDVEKRHLTEAVERGAGILDAGDLFCAMQGKWDPRADRSALREEYQAGQYLDTLVNEAVRFYGPYAGNWVNMSPGNHETAIRKRHETCLTERLVTRLNAEHGGRIEKMPYASWVQFRICMDYSSKSYTINLYQFHGSGGGGPVTRGVIGTNRRSVFLPDADVIWTGHTHDSWIMPITRERILQSGKPDRHTQYHISTPGYKDEFSPGDGWHIETGKPPKPIGAMWMRVFFAHSQPAVEFLEARE